MNIVVKQSDWKEDDMEIVFNGEEFQFTECEDLSTLMKEIGAFPSTSQARKAGRSGEIPKGFTEFKANKKKWIWIWNPSK